MNNNLFDLIKKQRSLSDGAIDILRKAVQEIYFSGRSPDEIVCGDIGSFARGTNDDPAPDMDIIFLNAPHDETVGYKDWTDIGTLELTGDKHGIVQLAEIERLDPRLALTIERATSALESYLGCQPGNAGFNWVRSWPGYPGAVFNISISDSECGEIAFDIDINYSDYHFGLEHGKRFVCCFERVTEELGPAAAVQLIADIKSVKKQAKQYARNPEDGWIDRSKKLPGFVVEGMFAYRFPPNTYADLMEKVMAHRWDTARSPQEQNVCTQPNQIIAAGFSFSSLLHELAQNGALTKGGWGNLYHIAERYSA